ncbi:hypothetical protein WN944_003850 [Citrus x changshan-huyou]|uniref:Uncharacterized protein n=1 Tax=Citrus x changshan-huyou TaxID=2935761 RepID=A0AAP0QI22_9ROSI
MASKPGILTDWPWTPLGNFKYIVLAPWIIHSTYSFMVKDEKERDLLNFLIFPFLLWRMLHNQIWISLSRYRTAKGRNRIVDKHIEFEQVDRERNWRNSVAHLEIRRCDSHGTSACWSSGVRPLLASQSTPSSLPLLSLSLPSSFLNRP